MGAVVYAPRLRAGVAGLVIVGALLAIGFLVFNAAGISGLEGIDRKEPFGGVGAALGRVFAFLYQRGFTQKAAWYAKAKHSQSHNLRILSRFLCKAPATLA